MGDTVFNAGGVSRLDSTKTGDKCLSLSPSLFQLYHLTHSSSHFTTSLSEGHSCIAIKQSPSKKNATIVGDLSAIKQLRRVVDFFKP